jgi:hypothetical protein
VAFAAVELLHPIELEGGVNATSADAAGAGAGADAGAGAGAGASPLAKLAAAASACFYAFEGVAVVLPVGNDLAARHRPRYPQLLVGSLLAVGALFAASASLTALGFPEIGLEINAASSIAYLAQRYAGTAAGTYLSACNVLVAVAVVATFPLQLTPVAHILEAGCGITSARARVALRLGAASGCCIFVLCVPNLSSLIDLVGAVANTALASLPCLLHARLLLRRPSGTRARAPSGGGGDGDGGCDGDGGGAAQAPPRFPRAEWVLLVLDALVVAFCAFVFAVGLGEALQELGLSTAVV